jgi:hypothetical protein
MDIETSIRVINHMIDALQLTDEQTVALYNAQWWLLGTYKGNPANTAAILHTIALPLKGTTAGIVLEEIIADMN